MKLLQLTTYLSRKAGGVIEVVEALHGEYLKQGNFDPFILGLEDRCASPEERIIPMENMIICEKKGPRSFAYSPAMKEHVLHTNYDLVHTHALWVYNSWVANTWRNLNQKPVVVTPHGMLDPWALQQSSWKKYIVRKLFEDQNLHNAACIHALNESEYESVRKFGLRNPVAIIPNGIYVDKVPKMQTPHWRKELPEHKKVLLFLGRLHKKKGLESLLQAWANLGADTKHEWVLAIAGWAQDGYGELMQELAQRLDVDASVLFLGPVFGQNKSACYQQANAFILPSFSEGLPMTILEAWANHLPVLMTKECNLSEAFALQAAIEIDHSVAKLTQQLKSFVSMSAHSLSDIAQNGHRLVHTKYNWETVAERFSELYKWLLFSQTEPIPSFVILD